ncbi:MAG: hypothetical protein HC871_07500 [Rhizobiales bacterium]|nr:hypothetical protein [Hyphomicrobiales bacterium]
MTELSYLFMTSAALAGLLSMISVWSRHRSWIRAGALGVAVLFLPLAYVSYATLLSKPKPVALEWWLDAADEATVLSSSIQEEVGIFLWLQLAEVSEPRAYVLPWNRELAEQLQRAAREAEEQNGQLQMRLPFEPSLDDLEPKFYAMPQPALPPKDLDRPPPKMYQQARRSELDA